MGISAKNRNYRDMMGYLRVQACLVSLAVIVASAIKGYIHSLDSSDPNTLLKMDCPTLLILNPRPTSAGPSVEVVPPYFLPAFRGPLLPTWQDNLIIDGIHPGKYTYQDDITLDK